MTLALRNPAPMQVTITVFKLDLASWMPKINIKLLLASKKRQGVS